MRSGFRPGLASIVFVFGLLGTPGSGMAESVVARIDNALQNITTLDRPGRVGYATFFDGNKYIQCRRMADRALGCEAAGTLMQSSLERVLTAGRVRRLVALGWVLDISFGNYTRSFPAGTPTDHAAQSIWQTLTEAYGAEVSGMEIKTAWVADVSCPPRAGPSQNLAGSVNDAPSMRPTAVRACAYIPPRDAPHTASPAAELAALSGKPSMPRLQSAAELIARDGPAIAAEIQRLRVNLTGHVHVVFDVGAGYIQCRPDSSPAVIYCEAQSAESFPALAAVLTPERVSRLRRAGYADPGRVPNYWRNYLLNKFNDAAIAREVLTILFDVYGYAGATRLRIKTEQFD